MLAVVLVVVVGAVVVVVVLAVVVPCFNEREVRREAEFHQILPSIEFANFFSFGDDRANTRPLYRAIRRVESLKSSMDAAGSSMNTGAQNSMNKGPRSSANPGAQQTAQRPVPPPPNPGL